MAINKTTRIRDPQMDARKRTSATKLADEVFRLVQGAQGRGFLSDGLEAVDDKKRLFGIVRWHLVNTEQAARILRKWLRKYDQL